MSVRFYVAGNPQDQRPPTGMYGNKHLKRETLAWRQDVVSEYRLAAQKLHLPMDGEYTGPIHLTCRGLGVSQDVSNFAKGVEDALLGVAYRDDSQILALYSSVDGRVLTDKGKPRRPKDVAQGIWVTVEFVR